MKIYDQTLPAVVHGIAHNLAADRPASHKALGLAGHSHKTQLCPYCYITKALLQDAKGYDIDGMTNINLPIRRGSYKHVPSF
jgi:hypothetical protein